MVVLLRATTITLLRPLYTSPSRGPRFNYIRHFHNESLNKRDDSVVPDFGDYSIILPPEPFVFGVSHIERRQVPSHILRPPYARQGPLLPQPSSEENQQQPLASEQVLLEKTQKNKGKEGSDRRIVLGSESEVRIREAGRLAKKVREYAGSLVQVCLVCPVCELPGTHACHEGYERSEQPLMRSMQPYISLSSRTALTHPRCFTLDFPVLVALGGSFFFFFASSISETLYANSFPSSVNNIITHGIPDKQVFSLLSY